MHQRHISLKQSRNATIAQIRKPVSGCEVTKLIAKHGKIFNTRGSLRGTRRYLVGSLMKIAASHPIRGLKLMLTKTSENKNLSFRQCMNYVGQQGVGYINVLVFVPFQIGSKPTITTIYSRRCWKGTDDPFWVFATIDYCDWGEYSKFLYGNGFRNRYSKRRPQKKIRLDS